MPARIDNRVVETIVKSAIALGNLPNDYTPILNAISHDTRVVMIGEASHGTEDFYKHRAEITKRLITEKGFNIVALEADWPDCYRVTKYVKGYSSCKDKGANAALGDFKRFPRWMWRNTVMLEFVDWLKNYNQNKSDQDKAGIYGLDIYSLQSSREAVIKHLEEADPELAEAARKNYGCFDRFADEQEYGQFAGLKLTSSCERSALKVLQAMLQKQYELQHSPDNKDHVESHFIASQNAVIVKGAEAYYRGMWEGGVNTWNMRDTHQFETLQRLLEHYDDLYQDKMCKAVVWAHNSHLGDCRATSQSESGELNIGQLVRQHYGMSQCFNIGFTTYDGTVTAAHNWDDDPKFMKVNPGIEGSFEEVFHRAINMSGKSFPDGRMAMIFRSNKDQSQVCNQEVIRDLGKSMQERYIGVIYRPRTEIVSHYIPSRLSQQYDAVIHIERSKALRPLEIHPQWEKGEKEHIPDTFPFEQ